MTARERRSFLGITGIGIGLPGLFLGSYLTGLLLLARLWAEPWKDLLVFPPESIGSHGLLTLLGQGLVLLGTVGMTGLVPGLPLSLAFAPARWSRLSLLLMAGLINYGLWAIAAALFKAVGWIPLGRSQFLFGWTLCFLLGVILVIWRRRFLAETLSHRWPASQHGWRLCLAMLLCVVAGTVGYPKFVVENFNGDATEIFAPAESLRTHWIPHWDLEADSQFGLPIIVPLWVYHYGMLPWLLALGPTEAAVRWPLLGYLFLLFLALARLLDRKREKPSGFLLGYVALALLFTTLLVGYYGGYDSYVADVAVGATYLFLALLVVIQLYCLQEGHTGLWILFALLAIGTRYWALFLSLAMLAAAWWRIPSQRHRLARVFLLLTVALGTISLGVIGIGGGRGHLQAWGKELWNIYGQAFWLPWQHPVELLSYLFQWALLGGIWPLGVLVLFHRLPPAGQLLALTTLAYGGFLGLVSPNRPTFYEQTILGLLTTATGGVALQQVERRHSTLLKAGASGILIGLILMAFPRPAAVNTANRQLGRNTCMLFPNYEEAMKHARIAQILFEQGRMGWHIDYSAWVHYSTVHPHPTQPFLYYVSDRPEQPVEGAILLAAHNGSFFFAATKEAADALKAWNPRPRPRRGWLRDLG